MSHAAAAEDRTLPAVVYGLYFLGFATAGLTTFLGLIFALARRGASGQVGASHYTLLIRTFWLGLAWAIFWGLILVVSFPLMFILVGVPLLFLAKAMLGLGVAWYALRLVLGVIHLARDEPYPRPYAWLA